MLDFNGQKIIRTGLLHANDLGTGHKMACVVRPNEDDDGLVIHDSF